MEQLIIPRPVNEKALRRWINDHPGTPADTFAWSIERCLEYAETHHAIGAAAFRPSDYTTCPEYLDASVRGRSAVDAVFHAVRNHAGPSLAMDEGRDGTIGCSFVWHDGAQYRIQMTTTGVLLRLFRLELTGEWVHAETGDLVPDSVWRTVRAFSRDRAGKVLALDDLVAHQAAATSWTEASGR